MAKRKKNKIKYSSFFAGIAGFLFYLIIIFLVIFGLSVQGSYTKSALPDNSQILQNSIDGKPVKTASPGLPIRLKIPKIKVDAAIESVGLTSKGEVDIPKGPINAAWFNLGPRPGDNGSAVITGHYGVWKGGKATVFNNLHKLRKGDKLYIQDSKGSIVTFVVRELRTYGANETVPDIFASSDGKAHLNLITCQGAWNKTTKGYPKRLVVFTDKE